MGTWIIQPMGRGAIALLVAAACLLAGVGCGGSDDSPTASSSEPAGKDGGAGGNAGQSPGGDGSERGGEGSSQGSSGSGGGSGGGTEEIDPTEFEVPEGGDDSIQTFGTEAEGEEKEAVVAAMRSFSSSVAANDYKKVCAELTEANVKQLETFFKAQKKKGTCATLLPTILIRDNGEARRAANGTVYQVRINDDTAFVLFKPEKGKASYLVMKREDDTWKSTSISAGTPLQPGTATPSS